MKNSLIEKLRKLGYKGENSDELLAEMPRDIWLSSNDKNFNRKQAVFSLMLRGKDAVFSISVQDNESGELYILHEEKDPLPANTIGRMIIFLHINKMIDLIV